MKRVGIIGGETHIGEITALDGKQLEIVGAVVRPDQVDTAKEQFGCPVLAEAAELYEQAAPEIIAVANENDLKAEAIMTALEAGCDVVVDKPLCLTLEEQQRLESFLANHPERRLLNLLTLRGSPPWMKLRDLVGQGTIGVPAFAHVRMAVRLKRDQRPPWFLDYGRSGGLFLDLLIHGIDQVEWVTGRKIVAVTANTGNLGYPDETILRDHAAVYCELDDGSAAVVEGQRMLPDSKGSDYRMTVAGTQGYADLWAADNRLVVTDPEAADATVEALPEPASVVEDWLADAADQEVGDLPEQVSVVADWLAQGEVIPQEASLRANRISVLATMSAEERRRIAVD